MNKSLTAILLIFIIPLLLADPHTLAQERYVVAPDGEVLPILPGQSASTVVQQRRSEITRKADGTCTDVFYFGYTPSLYPMNSNFGSLHGDVVGQWYVALANGRIDTIWSEQHDVGAFESTVYLRVHESLIGPDMDQECDPGPSIPSQGSTTLSPQLRG